MPIIPALSSPVISNNASLNEAAVPTAPDADQPTPEQTYSSQVYEQIISRNRDHLLVRLGERFDFSQIERLCQPYRRYAGHRGVEATYAIGHLVRALVVKRLYNWSYRKTAERMETDMLVRWFTGFDLHEPTPNYSTLQRFETWVSEHEPRVFFTDLLKQIDLDFPEEKMATQIGDTFAMQARIADCSLTQLLRDTVQRLWGAFEIATRNQVDMEALTPLLQAIMGEENEKPPFLLSPEERDERTLVTAQYAFSLRSELARLLQGLTPVHPPTLEIAHTWMSRLEKMLSDEFVFEFNADGALSSIRLCTKEERGSYRMISAVDPEATLRVHGTSITRGYNISVAATVNFVREIAAATGSTPDAVGVAPLIEAQLHHLGVVPPHFLYDRAAGTPKIISDVAKASQGRTQLLVHLVDYNRNRTRFGPADFTLGENGLLVCPNGQSTDQAYRSGSGDGWNYRFKADQCAGCPLTAKCRGAQVKKPRSHRQVFISDYVSQQRAAISYAKTDEFKQKMKTRPQIERVIAGLVRYNGARNAESYGLAQADYQVKMAAMAYNLKRWAALTRQKERERRVSPASG